MAMSNAGAVRMRVKIHAERSLDNSDAHCKCYTARSMEFYPSDSASNAFNSEV